MEKALSMPTRQQLMEQHDTVTHGVSGGVNISLYGLMPYLALQDAGYGITTMLQANKEVLLGTAKEFGKLLFYPAASMISRYVGNGKDGTTMQNEYMVDKIMSNEYITKWRGATTASGIRCGLRQNIAVQSLVTYNMLCAATLVDNVGYLFQGARWMCGAGRFSQKKFAVRNATKAFLMDVGLIAPSESNIKQVLENTELTPLRNGRVAYERKRLQAAARAPR